MMKLFSKSWKRSTQPRKQRKYRYNAPLHIKQKFVSAHLSKELRQKYGKRSAVLRKGDTVRVTRGKFRKKTGKIDRINLKKGKVYIAGLEITKRDGTKAFLPLKPNQMTITELNLDDKKRQRRFRKK